MGTVTVIISWQETLFIYYPNKNKVTEKQILLRGKPEILSSTKMFWTAGEGSSLQTYLTSAISRDLENILGL